MNWKRFWKTAVNLLLTAAILAGAWSSVRKPLPWKWEYRRMERAMLLEPMEILYHGEKNEVISVDDSHLALYTADWYGRPMWNNVMYLFPMKDGFGSVIRKEVFFDLEVWAYDASGRAARAEMELTVWDREHGRQTIRETAQKKDQLLLFQVDESRFEPSWMNRALEGMIAAETREHIHFAEYEDYESGYEMVLTFYDEAGAVLGTQESEGTYSYEN